MQATTYHSDARDTADAVIDIALALKGEPLSAALVFTSRHHMDNPEALHEALVEALAVPFVVWTGTSAFAGLVANEREPSLVVLGLHDVDGFCRAAPFEAFDSHTAAALTADMPAGGFRAVVTSEPPDAPADFLGALDLPGSPIAGGVNVFPRGIAPVAISSAGAVEGAALLAIDGVRAVVGVAQGAKILGPSRELTGSHDNVLRELDGRPALQALLSDLPAKLRDDLPKLGGSLYVGQSSADGDVFLMRDVVGLDPRVGAIAVNGPVRSGAEVVFAFRDGRAARHDLESMLFSMQEGLGRRKPAAVLVFSCTSRDARLAGTPLYDVGAVSDVLGGDDVPVVGVTVGGEFASFGRQTHMFQHAAVVVALLSDA